MIYIQSSVCKVKSGTIDTSWDHLHTASHNTVKIGTGLFFPLPFESSVSIIKIKLD